MKALVMSDTHGNYKAMRKMLKAEKDFSMIVHAGDVLEDVNTLIREFPQYSYRYVIGNNDFNFTVPKLQLFYLGNTRVMLTHGHTYRVKAGINDLYYKAREHNAKICIYGHTHIKYLEESFEGVYVLNPGCGYMGEYAVINIENDNIDIELKYV